MKKIFFLIVCTMLLLGIASYAMAGTEVTISGDARVRGIWKWDFDFDNANESMGNMLGGQKDTRYWDQRVRLAVHAKVDKVMVNTRMTVSEGMWGTGSTYGNVSLHDDDYAYLVVPVGPVTITAGRQLADWGNKFLVWNSGVDRFKMIYKVNEELTTGLFLDKATEKDMPELTGDTNKYVIPVIYKSNDLSAGLLYVWTHRSTLHQQAGDVLGGHGQTIDVYFVKAGDTTFAGEFAYANGNAVTSKKDAHGNLDNTGAQWGGFLAAIIKASDQATVTVAAATARNGMKSSKFFTPTLFFGTSQATAMIDFGANPIAGLNSAIDTTAMVVGVDYKIDDTSTAGAKIAYADMVFGSSPQPNGIDSFPQIKLFEFDASYNYKISDAANWIWEYGYLNPIHLKGPNVRNDALDNPAQVLVQRIEVKF